VTYAFDTDIFTLLTRGHANVKARYEKAVAEGGNLFGIPAVAWVEIIRGRCDAIKTSANGEELLKNFGRLVFSEQQLSRFARLPITESVSGQFDRWKKGKLQIRQADLLIACICLAHDATLVTRNLKDFKLVPGLKLENWAD
jgi:tRNA(fMet)-specific endonuclease VapC